MKKLLKVIILFISLSLLAVICTFLATVAYINNARSPLLWRYKVGNTVMSAPAIADGTIYFGSLGRADSGFYVLDSNTGQERWHISTNASVSWTPLVWNKNVYFSTDDGFFYGLDAETGAEKWHFGPDQRELDPSECNKCALHFRPAVLVEGIIYAGSLDHHLYVLDAKTGVEKWRFSAGDSISEPPAIVGNRVYVSSMDGNLYVLDTSTGKEVTRFSNSKGIYAGPLYDGDTIYIVDGSLVALDTKTGLEKWRFDSDPVYEIYNETPSPELLEFPLEEITSNILMFNDFLYVKTSNAMYAVEKNTGEKVWRFDFDDYVFSELTLSGRNVYIGDAGGHLYSVDAVTGEEVAKFNMHLFDLSSYLDMEAEFVFSPVVDDDIIYFGWNDELYAIQSSK